MTNPEKSVFISYRRSVAAFHARAIFQHLHANGYDVFMDVETIDNGQFDTIILNQIAARGHFLLVLTPGTLERCVEPNDWLRREIEEAMRLERNIVPLFINNFSFDGAGQYLTGKLAELPTYNGVNVPHDFFDAAMERLRTRFLKQPVYGTIQAIPMVKMTVMDYLRRGFTRHNQNDLDGAIADYTEVIRQKPQTGEAYMNRADARQAKGDLDGAIEDYSKVIQFYPSYVEAYINRGLTFFRQGKLDSAITDHVTANELRHDDAITYLGRGMARQVNGDINGAVSDYQRFLNAGGGQRFGIQEYMEQTIVALKARLGWK